MGFINASGPPKMRSNAALKQTSKGHHGLSGVSPFNANAATDVVRDVRASIVLKYPLSWLVLRWWKQYEVPKSDESLIEVNHLPSWQSSLKLLQ
jgi:hypothetical protein